MFYYLLNGAVLGLTAGLSPGPLMVLMIAETLRSGPRAGFQIALAPLVTDSTLVTIALVLTAELPARGLALISLIGGGIIIWMGWGATRATAPVVAETAAGGSGALWKGIATNLLNPQAFIFWLTVGGPLLKDAFGQLHWAGPLSFMGAFFFVMISVNLIVALGVSRGRQFLQGSGYRWTVRIAGSLLMLLGLWRLWKGIAGIM